MVEAGVFPTLSVTLQYRLKNRIAAVEHSVANDVDVSLIAIDAGSRTPQTGTDCILLLP